MSISNKETQSIMDKIMCRKVISVSDELKGALSGFHEAKVKEIEATDIANAIGKSILAINNILGPALHLHLQFVV